MNSYQTTERLPYSARQMFDLVADVERYWEFMPLCEHSKVKNRRTLADGCEELTATLEVLHRKTGLGGRLESLVHLDSDRLAICARSETGPVRSLINTWSFRDRGEGGCEAVFSIEYQMRGWPLQMVMNRLYGRVFEKLAAAFRKRADDIYGAAGPKPASGRPAAPGPARAR